MTTPALWHTNDRCPGCGAGLTLLDDGTRMLTVECRSCGTADTWTSTHPAAGGR
jgi:uncharacterized Zn finger protein